MRIFEWFYLLKVNNKNTRMGCGTFLKLIIDIIELNQLLWFYINWLFRVIPSLKIKREIWRQILIAVTLSTLFLNHLMQQICTLYALNLFIAETAWVRNMFKDGKCILVPSTESLEIQYKTFLKTLWFFNYNQLLDFDWLFTWLNWPIHREKEGVLYLQTWQSLLFHIIWYLVFQYSFLSFASKWLSRKKEPPHYS